MAVTDTWRRYTTEAVLKGSPVGAAVFYIGLGTTSFSVGTGDAAVGEIVGTGYARKAVQWSDFVGPMSNSNTIVFDVVGSWSPVGYAFIADASQGGSVLLYDSFTTVAVVAGDMLTINVGALTLS